MICTRTRLSEHIANKPGELMDLVSGKATTKNIAISITVGLKH